jgi:serine/threonine protein kinase
MLARSMIDGVLDGRFIVRETLRRDATAEAYLAYDQESGERVVLKVVSQAAASPALFATEAAILTRLWHPAVVRHVAHGTTAAGAPYLVTEWMEGEDLGERMRREKLAVGDVVTLGAAIASGLAAAHTEGIVHRDLQPRSVMLDRFQVGSARLQDFGLGQAPAGRTRGRAAAAVATRGYTAPEQLVGDQLRVGPQADVFSLGCILYEALGAGAPFEADDPEELVRKILFVDPPPLAPRVPGLPKGLAHLIESMLAKDPDDRPSGAAAVARALAAIPVTSRRDGLRLSIVRGPDAGLVLECGEPRVDIGRHPSCTLVLREGAVSKFHCDLSRSEQGTIVVRDLYSKNGVDIDGVRTLYAEVRDGAQLGIGHCTIRVECLDNGDFGPPARERALSGDTNVMLEGEGDHRGFAERLHARGARRNGPFASVYGSALRIADLASLSGGTLLLLEPETLSAHAQRALVSFAETRTVPTSRGRAAADVRVVTHSAVDLRLAVNGRQMMSDLFHVLAGVRVVLGPDTAASSKPRGKSSSKPVSKPPSRPPSNQAGE